MKLARFISIILHPVFMPFYSFLISLHLYPDLGIIGNDFLSVIYLVLIGTTIILPIASVIILIRLKLVDSFEMANHSERSLPLVITALCMCLSLYLLENILYFVYIIKLQLIGAILAIMLASLISKFWKISLHMLGVGGVLGIILSLNVFFATKISIFIWGLLISGVLGVARIYLKAHSQKQVYSGFLLGFLVLFCTLVLN